MRLDYPEATYVTYNKTYYPYSFSINKDAVLTKPKNAQPYWVNINYPKLKGELHITYMPVTDNLNKLLKEAQDITQSHTIKADGIKQVLYDNDKQKAYGTVYEVEGNAASPLQFYITDSTQHFLSGSVYFRAKPNYDSILPAAHYIKKDVQKLIETLHWK